MAESQGWARARVPGCAWANMLSSFVRGMCERIHACVSVDVCAFVAPLLQLKAFFLCVSFITVIYNFCVCLGGLE